MDDGKGSLSGVNTIQVEWTKSPSGQWQMKELPGSEKYYPAQLVLLAMGFLGPEKKVPTEIGNMNNRFLNAYKVINSFFTAGLPLDGRGNILTNSTYETSHPKVFAAGDW